MPWDTLKLSDGTEIPSIAYGTGSLGKGQGTVDKVDQAISVGFNHIDTAQLYRNEEEAGVALRESGLKREDVYITTKYSGVGGLDIATSIQNSLKNLGVKYVDLYLIHNPRIVPDIPPAWKAMEKVKADGLAKNIGVSNFTVPQLTILLASAKVKPAANQIRFHPYVLAEQTPVLEFSSKNGIIIEAYSPLTPLTRQPGGPVDAPVKKIADRLKAAPEQVLLAWAKAKGTVVVTTSSNKQRLESYLDAGDLELTSDDIAAIDAAGISGARYVAVRTFIKRAATAALIGAVSLSFCKYLGADLPSTMFPYL
ncbi:hypothetical protein EW026_g2415 [Hermanssonia centrifuga]|uniref:NADP-dependent oxidoreductase domain-containing protein n=1 Tax=Hermanssonia centrifuga TaxID=98765 RepID=A0A4S4KNC3_9APHY|nr:hypothetical protein EW026_g2415 [Hermanssonia centrifuga]